MVEKVEVAVVLARLAGPVGIIVGTAAVIGVELDRIYNQRISDIARTQLAIINSNARDLLARWRDRHVLWTPSHPLTFDLETEFLILDSLHDELTGEVVNAILRFANFFDANNRAIIDYLGNDTNNVEAVERMLQAMQVLIQLIKNDTKRNEEMAYGAMASIN